MSSNLKSLFKNVNVHSGQIPNTNSIGAKIMFFSITTMILCHKDYQNKIIQDSLGRKVEALTKKLIDEKRFIKLPLKLSTRRVLKRYITRELLSFCVNYSIIIKVHSLSNKITFK